MTWLEDLFASAHQWLFETLIQPLMYALDMGGLVDLGFGATRWLLVGLLQIAFMLAVILPLQRWRPVEPVQDRAAIRADILYTLIHRLGLFRLAMFFSIEPWFDSLQGWLRVAGVEAMHLDRLWPGVSDIAWISLIIYLIAFDFLDYWVHRAQHQFRWWWQLHALHHAQRQMTMWTDNRNHLLDDVIRSFILVMAAHLIGVGPGQFVAIVAFTQLSETLQHANLRLSFGAWGERLWISPRFHRLHHSIGIGHESAGVGTLGGHNFGVLLPWWDMLFGTANFEPRLDPTGVRDQVEPWRGDKPRDYGRGFWAQQWLGMLRLVGRA